jgi:predicted O-methyltransferase YrrM
MFERLFWQRPRILNVLHSIGLANATSQTNERELATIARYAAHARVAVEIGTYQGVSAAWIARSLAPEGLLYCVDPWLGTGQGEDPNFEICQRHLKRGKVMDRIRILRGFSKDVAVSLPERIEFAFIDGDHSWSGIETDWALLSPRIVPGGTICLHDTAIPESEPWRKFDSVRFYDEKIAVDSRFDAVERVHSLRVVRRRN